MNNLPTAYQCKKFFTARQIFKNTGIGACRSDGSLLLDTTHLHAKMTRLDNDDDPLGVKSRLQTLANLRGEPFLQLQTTGKGVDKPGQLAEAGYTTVGT